MTVVLAELAETARIPLAELRARLDHTGIGHAGHGLGWEARVRALVGDIAAENGGVKAGQVVGPHAANDDVKILAAERALHERLHRAFAEYPLGNLKSGAELEQIRNTPLKVWHERAALTDPSGSYLGMGAKICVAIPPDAHPKVHEIIEGLPSFVDGIQVWSEDWNQSPF